MRLPSLRQAQEHAAMIGLLIALAATSQSFAQTSAASSAHLPAWNDNSLIEVQKKGGDPARAGDVKIAFYGHDAFKISSPDGLTVLTDPWHNDQSGSYSEWFLRDFPALRVDIVLSTHAHFDHDAVGKPNALEVLERLVGQFRLGDVEITGLADKHQCEPQPADKATDANTCPPNNAIGLDNAIQLVATGGLRIAVWGDNRAVPDSSLDRYLKSVDVLILPVVNVLTRPEADAIIRKYDPKVIIPSHYFIEGLNNAASGLESVESWVGEQETHHADVRRLDRADLTLNPAELKEAHHRIYYFGNHVEKQ